MKDIAIGISILLVVLFAGIGGGFLMSDNSNTNAILEKIADNTQPVVDLGNYGQDFSDLPATLTGVYAGPDVAIQLSATNTARQWAIISNNSTTTPPSKAIVCLTPRERCTVANGIPLFASSSPLILGPAFPHQGIITVRAIASGTNVTITEK